MFCLLKRVPNVNLENIGQFFNVGGNWSPGEISDDQNLKALS
jgi:hypothetical protein